MRVSKCISSVAVALLGACLVGGFSAQAQAYSALYAFGDSLSDVGNLFLATQGALPAAPYSSGRFSNGPVWVEDVSTSLGLGPVLPYAAGGGDFAFGGAVTGSAEPGASTGVPTIVQQVGLFSLTHSGIAPSKALYSFWIGANDVLAALDDIQAQALTLAQAKADLTTAAQTAAFALQGLAAEGAAHFLVGLVPDLGVTPRYNTSSVSILATSLSALYNAQLVGTITALLPGASIAYIDTFKWLDAAVADPSAFGVGDVTHACYVGDFSGGGSVCANPDAHLFWDDIHPTAIGHQAIAALALSSLSAEAVSAVPLPPGFALFGSGLLILTVFARRSQASVAQKGFDATIKVCQ